MKKILFPLAILAMVFTGCSDDDDTPPETITIDSSMPIGAFTVSRSGSFVDQNNKGSAGIADLGTDTQGTQFLRFSSGFTSSFSTGTVTVYFSETNELMFDAGNGNPTLQIVGVVTSGGEKFFKINPTAENRLDHVILWCGAVGIPFGFAPLN